MELWGGFVSAEDDERFEQMQREAEQRERYAREEVKVS